VGSASAENYMWDCRVGKTHARRTQSDGSIRAQSEVRYKGIEEKKKRNSYSGRRGRRGGREWKCGSGVLRPTCVLASTRKSWDPFLRGTRSMDNGLWDDDDDDDDDDDGG
jgi:hypothetical protein